MSPWKAIGNSALRVEHILPELVESITLFRGVSGPAPSVLDFVSNHSAGRPSRGIEQRSTPVWMAVSMFDSPEILASKIRRFPKIGTHVAEIVLESGLGFAVARTGATGHVSVWGNPAALDLATRDVYPVS